MKLKKKLNKILCDSFELKNILFLVFITSSVNFNFLSSNSIFHTNHLVSHIVSWNNIVKIDDEGIKLFVLKINFNFLL